MQKQKGGKDEGQKALDRLNYVFIGEDGYVDYSDRRPKNLKKVDIEELAERIDYEAWYIANDPISPYSTIALDQETVSDYLKEGEYALYSDFIKLKKRALMKERGEDDE